RARTGVVLGRGGGPRGSLRARGRLPRRTATRRPLTSTTAETSRSRPRGSCRRIVNRRRLAHGREDGNVATASALLTVGPAAGAVCGRTPSRISATQVAWCWWPLPASVSATHAGAEQEFAGSELFSV